MRKVVQLIVAPDAEYSPGTYSQGFTMALCDDGTIWSRVTHSERNEGPEPFSYRYWFKWELIEGPPTI